MERLINQKAKKIIKKTQIILLKTFKPKTNIILNKHLKNQKEEMIKYTIKS